MKTWMKVGLSLLALVVVGIASIAVTGLWFGFIGGGTPGDESIEDPLAQAQQVLVYARRLTFADSLPAHERRHLMDEQWLEVKRADTLPVEAILGPRARIFPEVNSHRNTRGAFNGTGRGKGRIVAKIEVEPDANRGGIGYRKLRLEVGVNYLWIDSMVGRGDSVSIRAIIFSENGQVATVPNAHMRIHHKSRSSRAQARWQFDPQDPCMCESCVKYGWCQVCGDFQ
jgi:hypothetical protein